MSYSKALHFKNSAYQAHFAQGITINKMIMAWPYALSHIHILQLTVLAVDFPNATHCQKQNTKPKTKQKNTPKTTKNQTK
ncbi:hypothetical protein, partial [Klebsiella michiganensis]|uniref:hypothetical protein n=1 Tax=Klebsiella michiganensis TaxID=1134687 RepID=UPI0038559060